MTAVLMIICAVLFIMGLSREARSGLATLFSLSLPKAWQVWRLVTFQFLHGSVRHFMFNMLGLYFFAVPLERAWGGRKFIVFYLLSGVFGGLCFLVLMRFVELGPAMKLVGASGGILASLAACAILYPQMVFIIF
ncbi:MAG: rhomboid family intramembrane serine protease, partial [Planctomycetota bacterium]